MKTRMIILSVMLMLAMLLCACTGSASGSQETGTGTDTGTGFVESATQPAVSGTVTEPTEESKPNPEESKEQPNCDDNDADWTPNF